MHFRGRSLPWRDQKLQSPTCQEEHLRLALERLFLGAGARGRTRVARVGRAARDALEDRKTTSPDRPEETLSGPSFETLSQQRRRRELLALILMWPLLLVAARVGGIVTHLEHDQSTGPRHIRHVGRSTKGSW
ncbi:unnamed protein product [Durusdinium trenchii]|uniref:Uncharacterized protein n=1 Tax=Durusdinium trenchii TaxID=1381693 RepID=A0ABP0N360_9DINO